MATNVHFGQEAGAPLHINREVGCVRSLDGLALNLFVTVMIGVG